ncbi:MAG: DUF4405 domain-containing protein [Candidatus Hydrogenedentes bacterium]|nr:DUF4405 domain-containing protein [Candidatus Hydrogenedentota bacterium]
MSGNSEPANGGPEPRKPFHWRGLTSLFTTVNFLTLAVTGAVLYASPQGRVAHWTGWTVWGLDREQWGAIHMVSSLAFLIAGGFHLYFNWTTFWSYFRSKLQAGFNLKRECALALLLMIVIIAGTVLGVPPFSTIIHWNDGIKAYWEARSVPGPYPHAEESSLTELAAKTGVPLDEMLGKLRVHGFEPDDPAISLKALAAKYGKTPSELFAVLKGGAAALPGDGRAGFGRKTVQQISEEHGVPVEQALALLRDAGIDAGPGSTMRALADSSGKTPSELAGLIARAR